MPEVPQNNFNCRSSLFCAYKCYFVTRYCLFLLCSCCGGNEGFHLKEGWMMMDSVVQRYSTSEISDLG